MSRVKPMAAMAGGAKPFVWFGRACDSLTEADVATIRGRLVRELAHVLSYMAVSDLEKPNEPVVVLFTRLPPEVIRPHLINPPRAGAGAGAGGTELSATETARLRSLRRAVEEARGVLNPRLLLLIPVASPWTWTFVFLRSHERLRPALHRLAPAAAQLVADRHVLLLPRLAVLDDLTPGAEVVARLRHRVAQALRPLLTWMAEEGEVEAAGGGGGSGGGGGGGGGGGQPQAAAPGPEGRGGAGGGAPEKLPVLFVAADVDLLAQRFVTATEAPPPPPPPQPLSVSGERSPAPGAAPTGGAHALRASLDMSIEGWDEAVPAYCEAAAARRRRRRRGARPRARGWRTWAGRRCSGCCWPGTASTTSLR